jgi:hypothetical protein
MSCNWVPLQVGLRPALAAASPMLRLVAKFCRRCGSSLEPGDLYCGECGTKVPGAAGDPEEPTQAADVVREGDEDFFAAWDRGLPRIPQEEPPPPSRPEEAVTETIATARPGDTAVLPATPPEPYLDPGTGRRPAPPHDAAAPGGAQVHPPRPAPRTRQGFPLGATLALIGALAVIVSALLEWIRDAAFSPGGGVFPRDIAVRLLLDPGGAETGVNLGIVLLAAGVLGAMLALITMVLPVLKFLRRLVGLATLAIPGLFVFRIVQELLSQGALDQIWGVLGIGVYTAAVGAFTQMVAGRWFRR